MAQVGLMVSVRFNGKCAWQWNESHWFKPQMDTLLVQGELDAFTHSSNEDTSPTQRSSWIIHEYAYRCHRCYGQKSIITLYVIIIIVIVVVPSCMLIWNVI